MAAYTLALEGSILAFFYYSGRGAIERQSQEEVRVQAALARAAVERALADSLAELAGLRAQLLLYPMPAGRTAASLKLVEQFATASPQKYAEIGVLDRATQRMLTVRVISELGAIYPVVEDRAVDEPAGGCPPGGGGTVGPCVQGLPPGPREELMKIVVPLTDSGSSALVVYLRVDALLETIGALASPPNISVIAANPRGLILHSADVSLLRTYLPKVGPKYKAVCREQLEQPEVVLTVQKDLRADLGELRKKLFSVASFTAVFTLLAFMGAWILTGRMASSLRRVTAVASSVASGDFSRRIDIQRNDELGLLIDTFNGMTVKLEENYRALTEVNLQLHSKIRELTRTRRRLSEKQRLAAVGEALSKISHEIQNKIGGAGVWVQNLERYGQKDENTSLCIRELKAALASFLDMLVHFKRFYRQPQLSKQRIPAKDLIEACLARVSAEFEVKELSVVADLGEDAVDFEVDPAQMTDAIVNILLNAAHFSPVRGALHIGLRRDNNHVVLSFRDQGPGLPPKAKLFQPFYTTKPTGSGLGLAIVRNIVHAHSGRIRAYNDPEGGACFEMRLPV